jgi:hypothetical protein
VSASIGWSLAWESLSIGLYRWFLVGTFYFVQALTLLDPPFFVHTLLISPYPSLTLLVVPFFVHALLIPSYPSLTLLMYKGRFFTESPKTQAETQRDF